MKRLRGTRRLWIGVLVLAVLSLVAASVFAMGVVRRPWPQTSGEIALDGLTGSVTVIRDARGVPHIYADNPTDLFRGQGYVAAQDRFFEMDLRRHITAGRLAELVGASGVATDKVIRTLGWRKVAEAELPKLSPDTRQYLQAYADGVNDYLARMGSETSNLSLEYLVLDRQLPGYRPERWTSVDSLAWLKAMAWDLKANLDNELARARLQASIDPALVAVLYPPYPSQHAPIVSAQDWQPTGSMARSVVPPALSTAAGSGGPTPSTSARPEQEVSRVLADAAAALDAIPTSVGRGDDVGSNSWAIAPSKSATGKALLANDPHLAISQPGIWYQAGLHCRARSSACPFDVSGFTFAGLPGVVIGHNTTIAWGLTNLPADTADVYLERVSGQTYLRDGKQVPLEVSTETIKVRGADDVPVTIRRTGHGPIINEVIGAAGEVGRRPVLSGQVQNEQYAVSLAWTGLVPSPTLDSLFAINTAQDFQQFRAAARGFASPAQNLLYADTAGNIGYQAPGLIPVRRASTPGVPPGYLPAPGWDSQWDWQGWVPFEDLPWVLNPSEGFIVAANQQVTPASMPFLSSEFDYGWRSQRIRERLTALPKVSLQDMQQIQMDDTNVFAKELVPALLAVDLSNDPFTREAQDLLRSWDFTQPADGSTTSAAAAYYNAVWTRLLQATFDDQLPVDLRADGGARWRTAVRSLLANPSNPWWDDKRTPSVVENRDEILSQALVKARLDMTRALNSNVSKWSWGNVHTATLRHKVFGADSIPGPVRAMFNRGPVEVSGGSAIVNAMSWNAAQGYQVVNGVSMRMVVDLGDLDRSTWVNQTGNSGHAYHPNYSDQTEAWVQGTQFPWASSEPAVQAAKVAQLTFVPKR